MAEHKSNIRLSIVIISWNSLSSLRPCLKSIGGLLDRTDTELIWVDNGSSDGAASYVAEHYPDTHTVLLPENRGVAAARNEGLRRARGEKILFLDDDTEASAEAIDTMTRYMDEHTQAGIVACALRNAQGELQNSFKPYPGLGVKITNILRSKLGLPQTKTVLPDKPVEPCYVIGACQLLRHEMVERIGELDQAIFYGPEDADYCIRARRAGYRVVYLPQVSIMHHWRRITSRSLSSATSRRHIAGLLHFWRTHRRIF